MMTTPYQDTRKAHTELPDVLSPMSMSLSQLNLRSRKAMTEWNLDDETVARLSVPRPSTPWRRKLDGSVQDSTTLRALQSSTTNFAGFLHKLTLDNLGFKLRYFVLTEEASLFLFRTNADPGAKPVACLHVASVSAFKIGNGESFVMEVQGQGLEGAATALAATKRVVWTLQCEDELTCGIWMRCFARIVKEEEAKRRDSGLGSSIASSSSSASLDSLGDSTFSLSSPKPVGFVKPPRPMSPDSVNMEEREAKMKEMHEDYVKRLQIEQMRLSPRLETPHEM